MKKIALFLVLSMLLLPLCGCGSAEKSGIAFICSPAGVEDRYEGQALKTAIFAYCTEKGLPYREYISDGSADYFKNAALSAAQTCDIVICDSKASAELAQTGTAYQTSFLFVNYTGSVGANGRAVAFSEEDAAFLAGYAAVCDGKRHFAFFAGERNDMSCRYLNGFVQGIDAASSESAACTVTYYFTGSDEAGDEAKAIAQSMFMDGSEIMMVAGGEIYKSAVQAANVTKKFLIGCEMDQAGESERFVTTAMKEYSTVLAGELDAFYDSKAWSAGFVGKSVVYRYSHGAVGIPTYTGAYRFASFPADMFANIGEMLKAGSLTVSRGTSLPAALQHTTVTERARDN